MTFSYPQQVETTLTDAIDKIPSSKAINDYIVNPYQYQFQNRSIDLNIPAGLSFGSNHQFLRINFARRDAGCQIMFTFRDAIGTSKCECYYITFESTSADMLRTLKIDNACRVGFGTLSLSVPDDLLNWVYFYYNLFPTSAMTTKLTVTSAVDDIIEIGDWSTII